jgi:hypothetical protein
MLAHPADDISNTAAITTIVLFITISLPFKESPRVLPGAFKGGGKCAQAGALVTSIASRKG